jgi:non-ribosomal peptide synthetase component E (peptide arylation enzyme)
MKIDAYLTEHARKTPSRIALEEGNNSISYGALEASVNNIAHLCGNLGIVGLQYLKRWHTVYKNAHGSIQIG